MLFAFTLHYKEIKRLSLWYENGHVFPFISMLRFCQVFLISLCLSLSTNLSVSDATVGILQVTTMSLILAYLLSYLVTASTPENSYELIHFRRRRVYSTASFPIHLPRDAIEI